MALFTIGLIPEEAGQQDRTLRVRTAGAALRTVGSPTPSQTPPEGMMSDSSFGICAMPIEP